MKNFIKKFMVTICVMSMSFTLMTTVVTATEGFRSGPNEGTSVTDTVKSSDKESDGKSVSATNNSQTPSSVTTQANAQNVSSKKYLTKWGGFFWFLLSVIVNFVLSCWVGNRFYRLARRSAQSSAEIRALRKDIEERFASTLTDINEPITEVINRNESYARNDEGMEMPERRPSVEINEEEREILGRWDMKRTAVKEADADEDEAVLRTSRTYSPKRAMSGIEFEDDDDDESENASHRGSSQIRERMETITKAGNKAKDFLSNIFPFDE